MAHANEFEKSSSGGARLLAGRPLQVATTARRLAGTLAPPIAAKSNHFDHGINFFSDQQN
jgi:hypothetical protein